MMRQSLFFTASHTLEIREEERPTPEEGQVLVESIASAISPGTELLIYRGQAPTDLDTDTSIAALAGSLAYPLKYGYACVGRVAACGVAVDPSVWLGRLVFAFNPHETHFTAPLEALQPLPQGIDIEQALFLPNMETALSLTHDGCPMFGERVVVFGQGVVGLLTVALLGHMPLESLTAVDRYPSRLAHATRLGASQTITPDKFAARTDLHAAADLTYEVSGAPAALDAAIQATGFGGRVVIGSWYGTKPVSLDLGGYFHRSRIQLISSQVSSLNPVLSGRWSKERRLKAAWGMLARLQPTDLITHRIPFEQATDAYTLLDQSPQQSVQVVLTYGADI